MIRPLALLTCMAFSVLSVPAHAAAYNPDTLFPERDGWVALTRAGRWELRLPTIPPAPKDDNVNPAPLPAPEPRNPATPPEGEGAGSDSATSSAPANTEADVSGDPRSMTATPAQGGDNTEGAAPDAGHPMPDPNAVADTMPGTSTGQVAVVGSGDGQSAQRAAPPDDTEPPRPALPLAGVRYRVLDAGDELVPGEPVVVDREYVYIRATAKDLAGNPVGPEGRAEDEDERGVRRFEWSALPTALALAVEQMPYHARWEVFVPVATRPSGKGGAYRMLRSRALVFDVQRFDPPPPKPANDDAAAGGSMTPAGDPTASTPAAEDAAPAGAEPNAMVMPAAEPAAGPAAVLPPATEEPSGAAR